MLALLVLAFFGALLFWFIASLVVWHEKRQWDRDFYEQWGETREEMYRRWGWPKP